MNRQGIYIRIGYWSALACAAGAVAYGLAIVGADIFAGSAIT